MGTSFEKVWPRILRDVRPALIVKNWGLARGYTGGTFHIDHVSSHSILVSGGKMTSPRNVTKADFEKVYAVWDEYQSGGYTRAKMTELSQNTTYILSILHRVL